MSNKGNEYSTAERELAENGVYMSNTVGHSMEPFLCHHRDAVIISRPQREIRKYDVILYPGKPGSYILHRVIATRGDTLIVRGDNNFFKEYVPKSDVIGVLTSFVRRGKRGSVTDLGYRFYSVSRVLLYPLRSLARRIRAMLGRLRRSLFGGRSK